MLTTKFYQKKCTFIELEAYLAITCLLDKLVSALQKCEVIIGIFIDFRIAFDHVDHTILPEKMYFIELGALLIKDYPTIGPIENNLLNIIMFDHLCYDSNVVCQKVLTLVLPCSLIT